MPLNVKDLTTDELAALLRAFNSLARYRREDTRRGFDPDERDLYEAIQDEFWTRD